MLAIAVWTGDLDSLHTINKSFVFLNFKPATLLIHNRRIHPKSVTFSHAVALLIDTP